MRWNPTSQRFVTNVAVTPSLVTPYSSYSEPCPDSCMIKYHNCDTTQNPKITAISLISGSSILSLEVPMVSQAISLTQTPGYIGMEKDTGITYMCDVCQRSP